LSEFDLSTPAGRRRALSDYLWTDHAYLRLAFSNAHWISDELVRTNQPWPFQLKRWADSGIKTVVNLRGGRAASFRALEIDACGRYGLKMVDFVVASRDVPTRDQVLGARALFDGIAYPALMHCKSGADRAGLMGVLYKHFRGGEPVDRAASQLSLKYLHVRAGLTGVLDFWVERYLAEGAAAGLTLEEWVSLPHYDPAALKAEFRAGWWGTLLADRVLRRE
jgi:protein tyrosine/serine phosphatase